MCMHLDGTPFPDHHKIPLNLDKIRIRCDCNIVLGASFFLEQLWWSPCSGAITTSPPHPPTRLTPQTIHTQNPTTSQWTPTWTLSGHPRTLSIQQERANIYNNTNHIVSLALELIYIAIDGREKKMHLSNCVRPVFLVTVGATQSQAALLIMKWFINIYYNAKIANWSNNDNNKKYDGDKWR